MSSPMAPSIDSHRAFEKLPISLGKFDLTTQYQWPFPGHGRQQRSEAHASLRISSCTFSAHILHFSRTSRTNSRTLAHHRCPSQLCVPYRHWDQAFEGLIPARHQ
eukprot:1136615-Pelagomonas_calceolata.AAC.2